MFILYSSQFFGRRRGNGEDDDDDDDADFHGDAGGRRRQSFGGAALRYSNRKSPPRTRSRGGVDGDKHAEGLGDEPNTLRRRINYDENAEEKFKVYLEDEDDDEREAETPVVSECRDLFDDGLLHAEGLLSGSLKVKISGYVLLLVLMGCQCTG